MMDDLRQGMDEHDPFEGEQSDEAAVEGIDAAVIDRLAGYGHGPEADRSTIGDADAARDDSVAPAYEVDPAYEADVVSTLDLAVEDDHVVATVVEHSTDKDAPEVEHTASGPSEPGRRQRFTLRARRGTGTSQRRDRSKADKRAKKIIGLEIGASQIAVHRLSTTGLPSWSRSFESLSRRAWSCQARSVTQTLSARRSSGSSSSTSSRSEACGSAFRTTGSAFVSSRSKV